MLESDDNAFVNYDVMTVEVNTSSVVCAGNVNCEISGVETSNISYHIVQNFDGGFDVFDAFQLDRQNLTNQIV